MAVIDSVGGEGDRLSRKGIQGGSNHLSKEHPLTGSSFSLPVNAYDYNQSDYGHAQESGDTDWMSSYHLHPQYNQTSTTSSTLRNRRRNVQQRSASYGHNRGYVGHGRRKSDQRSPRVLESIKKSIKQVKVIPKIRDINAIDKYSRIFFPVSFIIFNAFYWTFYIL